MTLEIHLELKTIFAYSIKGKYIIIYIVCKEQLLLCVILNVSQNLSFQLPSFIQLNSYYNVCGADLEIH